MKDILQEEKTLLEQLDSRNAEIDSLFKNKLLKKLVNANTGKQSKWNLFLLQRRDIVGTYDLKRFTSFLPWQGDPKFLQTETPTPTP